MFRNTTCQKFSMKLTVELIVVFSFIQYFSVCDRHQEKPGPFGLVSQTPEPLSSQNLQKRLNIKTDTSYLFLEKRS